jgi:hypothetical protein
MKRIVGLLLAVLVAGCVTQPSTDSNEAPSATSDVLAVEVPKVDARATLAALKTFSEAYPYRQSGDPTHEMSRDWLAAELKDAGLTVVRQRFPSHVAGQVGAYEGENVIGIKWGSDRGHWIVVGGHYDITEGAVYGAYDDGSGTIMSLKLGEAFADVETDRTIAFILFDQEEKGLVGSRFFVKSVLDGTFEYPVTVDGMIDLDMIGITYPHPAKIVVYQNSPQLKDSILLHAKAVGMPEAQLAFRKPKGGSSDGVAFLEKQIATAYFWSNWDEVVTKDGQSVPDSYPFWHQADTYETMTLAAGDEATLRAGFQTVLDIVSPVLAKAADADFIIESGEPEV